MKNLFFTLLCLGFCLFIGAQSTPKVGDELIVKAPNGQNYNYVKFPKLNTLIKRGQVGNYKSIYDNTVVVEKVLTKDNGSTYVILKKKDGSKFFGLKTSIKANYTKAIEAGELATTS